MDADEVGEMDDDDEMDADVEGAAPSGSSSGARAHGAQAKLGP